MWCRYELKNNGGPCVGNKTVLVLPYKANKVIIITKCEFDIDKF